MSTEEKNEGNGGPGGHRSELGQRERLLMDEGGPEEAETRQPPEGRRGSAGEQRGEGGAGGDLWNLSQSRTVTDKKKEEAFSESGSWVEAVGDGNNRQEEEKEEEDGDEGEEESELSEGWPRPISQISMGEGFSLVLAGGRVMAFGEGDMGRLGLEDKQGRRVPTEIPGLSRIKFICAGSRHSVAVHEDNRIFFWGYQIKALEDIGLMHKVPDEIRRPRDLEEEIVGLTCGEDFSAVWTKKGDLFTWGWHKEGQLCLSQLDDFTFKVEGPTKVPNEGPKGQFEGKKVTEAIAGVDQMIVLTEDREHFFVCGSNSKKRLEKRYHENSKDKEPLKIDPQALKVPLESSDGGAWWDFGGTKKPPKRRKIVTAVLSASERRFAVFIVEDPDGRKRLYGMGKYGLNDLVPGISRDETMWEENKFTCGSDEALTKNPLVEFDSNLDVLEVSAGKSHLFVRLSDNSVALLGKFDELADSLAMKETETGAGDEEQGLQQKRKYVLIKELKGVTSKLPKTYGSGYSTIVLTENVHLMGAGKNPNGQLGIGDRIAPFSEQIKSVRVFTPLKEPLLAPGRWCNIPTRLKTQFGWQDNTKTWEDPIPLRSEEGIVVRPNGVIKGENAPTNLPTQAKKEKPYFPSRRVEVGDAVNFFCTGGLLYPPGGSVCKRRKRQKANETENFKQSETAGQTSELRDRGEIAAGETNGEEEEETLEPDFVPSLEDIECLGCRVPDKWRRGSEQQKFIPSDSFPVTVVEYNDAYSDVWEKYTNGTPIKEGTRVLFSCPTGALTIASATCRTRKSPETKQRFIAFDPPESYVDCKGCPVPSQWVDPPQKAPLLPVTLEVQRGGKGEWLERADNSAIGAGDLVRFRCATGKLVSDAVTESPSGASADEGEGAGVNGTATSRVRVVECQRNGTSEPTLHFNSTAHVPCSGCRVPYEWLGKGGGSRIVTASRVFRSRSPAEEQAGSAGEEFKEAETSIGVNDTISFECVRGGVLHLQSSLSQSGSAGLRGATCVNPGGEELGESEFGLNISDVKCVRSPQEWFLLVTVVVFLFLLVGGAILILFSHASRRKRRREKMARLLNFQKPIIPPINADVSEMRREKPINNAVKEISPHPKKPIKFL